MKMLLSSCLDLSYPLQHYEVQHPRLPALHYLPEFAQTHVHWVNDAIQASHPLFPSLLHLPSFSSIIKVFSIESTLHIRWTKYWSFSFSPSMNIQGWFPLRLIGFTSLLSKGCSRVFSSATDWKHQFFSTQLSLWSKSHMPMW